jgi:molybdopterin synthase catalytic subunit
VCSSGPCETSTAGAGCPSSTTPRNLGVGDLAVVVAAAAPHRGEAFDACRRFIDELKRRVPIWKHQLFADGDEEWVGSP